MNEEIDWSKLSLPVSKIIKAPPAANWSFYFGDSKDIWFQFYIKNPPNRFQRWMFRKILGIRWEPVK